MSDSALLLISKFYRNRSLWCFVEYERTHCGMYRNQCNKLKTIIYYSLLFRTKNVFFPACTDLIHALGIFNLFACSESTKAFSCTRILSCCCYWYWLCSFSVWFEASRRQFKSFRLKYSALALELCLFIIPILYCRAFVVCSTNANKKKKERERKRAIISLVSFSLMLTCFYIHRVLMCHDENRAKFKFSNGNEMPWHYRR